jgi:hypothetical protein
LDRRDWGFDSRFLGIEALPNPEVSAEPSPVSAEKLAFSAPKNFKRWQPATLL